MGKYWKQPKEDSVYVSFELEGEKSPDMAERTGRYGESILARPEYYPRAACFSAITYYPISEEVTSILYKQPIKNFAYNEAEIRRWIADINEIGFPCTIVEIGETVKIRLDFSNFETKEHMISTLYLIRVLHEAGRNKVPDRYFEAMDANPEADKFIEIQRAHKPKTTASRYDYEGGHTGITNSSNPDLTKEQVFANFKKLGKEVHYPTAYNVAVHTSWGTKAPKGYAI